MSTASKVFFLYWSLTVSIQTSQCLPSKQCQRGELIKLSDLQEAKEKFRGFLQTWNGDI